MNGDIWIPVSLFFFDWYKCRYKYNSPFFYSNYIPFVFFDTWDDTHTHRASWKTLGKFSSEAQMAGPCFFQLKSESPTKVELAVLKTFINGPFSTSASMPQTSGGHRSVLKTLVDLVVYSVY